MSSSKKRRILHRLVEHGELWTHGEDERKWFENIVLTADEAEKAVKNKEAEYYDPADEARYLAGYNEFADTDYTVG